MHEKEFAHRMSAHCENGVTAALLSHRGLNISEPMVFGIGSGLFFIYLPFVRVNHAPGFSYRHIPGEVFKHLTARLGVRFKKRSFPNPAAAQKALDENLARNIPTGLQVGVFNIPYFPDKYRFHFNGHNLIVYGKKDGRYLISDPVMEHPTTMTEEELNRVRFAKGPFTPNGLMYYPVSVPEKYDLKKAVVKGIRNTVMNMEAPVFLIGIRGMKHVSREIRKWPARNGIRQANHILATMIRMQEEIGTGGAGFRFIFAAFLQEAAAVLGKPALKDLSLEMTAIGDLWRDFAVEAIKVYKDRSAQPDVYNVIADRLLDLAVKEEQFFRKLGKAVA